jgi:type I restriction enzyme, R subunit
MPAGFAESDAEEAALSWLESLGYPIRHGPEIAYNIDGGERSDPGYQDTLLRVEGPNLLARNRALHRMLVAGVNVEYTRSDGSISGVQAKVIDFEQPEHNDWLVVNQFTVIEGHQSRRADIVILINGLPLGAVELKNPADESATL